MKHSTFIRHFQVVPIAFALLLAACQPPPGGPGGPGGPLPTQVSGGPQPTQAQPQPTQAGNNPQPTAVTQPTAVSAQPTTAATSNVDLTNLPLGDSKVTSSPTVGGIWPCHTDPNGGGSQVNGPWIKGDTYDFTAKAIVDGTVTWQSSLAISTQGDQRVITSNGLPNHPTGNYPVAANDDVAQYDRNPSSIQAQTYNITMPLNPTLAAEPTCAPGEVGILLTGAIIFNALDAPGRDAVAHESQDSCGGHPQNMGMYHYHSLTNCLTDNTSGLNNHSPLMGYIWDGFGLYGHHGEGGVTLASADLDECHGHTHQIAWEGQSVNMYHYHATWDFPYTVGCMRGNWTRPNIQSEDGGTQDGGGTQTGGGQGTGDQQGQPDLAAAAAKLGITEQALRDALGPPPPDFAAAAAKLGITEAALREALGVP